MSEICKNCGAWHGLHQAETMQCPRNGQEAMPGRRQEWDDTTYEEASDPSDIEAQAIAQQRTIAEQAQIIREHEANNVIVLEALRSQAAELARLREQVRRAHKSRDEVFIGKYNNQ